MAIYIPSEVFVHFTEMSRHINKCVMTLATIVLLCTLVGEESFLISALLRMPTSILKFCSNLATTVMPV